MGSHRNSHSAVPVFSWLLVALVAVALALAPGGASAGSQGPHLVLVPLSDASRGALSSPGVHEIVRYRSFALAEAAGADLRALENAGASVRDDLATVTLAGRSVDPLDRPALKSQGAGAPARPGLALVQFVGPVKNGWLERLRSTGVRVVTYSGEDSYLVHGSARALRQAAALRGVALGVRAVIPYRAADKLTPGIATGPRLRVAIQTVSGTPGSTARSRIAEAGSALRPRSSTAALDTQFVDISRSDLVRLASDAGVVGIDPYSQPRLRDERAAQIVAGNLSGSVPSGPGYASWIGARGFDGSLLPFAIDFTDEGLDAGSTSPDHPDFYLDGSTLNPSRVAYVNNWTTNANGRDCGGHGTNVASIAAGFNDDTTSSVEDDQAYHYGLGIAPAAQIGASKIFRCQNGFFSLQGTFTGLTSAAYAGGARISSNSWGAAVDGDYNADSQEYDALVRDAQPGVAGNQQMVEVFASGNEGPGGQSLDSPGTAKNVISVGASENVRAGGTDGCGITDGQADSATDVAWFSSRGPTSDGRQKPDLIAPGTHVTGASPQHAGYTGDGTCDPQFPAGNTLYSRVSGTSQATPEVSGAAAMVMDWWRRMLGGDTELPSPAMVKAILLNAASDAAGGSDGNGGTVPALPSVEQGWGRVSLGNALDDTMRQFRDQSDLLTATGQSVVHSYDVTDTGKPLKVTLVWTDPPGPTIGKVLVNDLDLVVTAGGKQYKGNVFSGGQSALGGSADSDNNVENVFLPAGTSGRIGVQVVATNLAGDGVPDNGEPTDQDFALVVSNAQPTVPNEKPVASFTAAPSLALAGQNVAFDASGSLDPDGQVTDYAWDFGDGSTAGPTADPSVEHSYIADGSYTVTLSVTDNDGGVDVTQDHVTVQAGLPTASFVASPNPVLTGQSIGFDASASSDADGPIADYAWNFGDKSAIVHTSSPTTAHIYMSAGLRTVHMTVTDGQGSSAGAQGNVTVLAPDAPPPLVPNLSPPGVGPTTGGKLIAPKVSIARHRLRLTRGGSVRLQLSCPVGASLCQGTIKLTAALGTSVPSRSQTIGRGVFNIPGGRTRSATVHLSRMAQQVIAIRKSIKARVTIAARDAAGNTRSSGVRLTLLGAS